MTAAIRHRRLFVGLAALSLVLTACGQGGQAGSAVIAPEPVVDAEVYGGFPIDPPGPDEVVLTLVGQRTVELTMRDLEQLEVTEVTFVEPFVNAEQTFRVVPLVDLFALAGITPSDTVDTIALNDYRYRDTAGALVAADALLAVARDGAPIPMDAGGPIRLVFEPSSEYAGFLDAWNWSLRSISVVAEP